MRTKNYLTFLLSFFLLFFVIQKNVMGKDLTANEFKSYMVQFYKKNFSLYMVREGKELYSLSGKDVVFKGNLGQESFYRLKKIGENPVQRLVSRDGYVKLMKIIYKGSLKGYTFVFKKNDLMFLIKKNSIIKFDFNRYRDKNYREGIMAFANSDVEKEKISKRDDDVKIHKEEVEYTNLQTESSWESLEIFSAIVNGSYMTLGIGYTPYFKMGTINLEFIPKISFAPGKTNKNEMFYAYSLAAYIRNYLKKSYFEFGTGIQSIPKLKYTDPILSVGAGYKQRVFLFDSIFANFNYITSQTPRFELVIGMEYRY